MVLRQINALEASNGSLRAALAEQSSQVDGQKARSEAQVAELKKELAVLRGEMGEPSEQLAEMQALLREVKQRSALRVLGAVIGMWSHAKTVQMVEKWRAQAAMVAERTRLEASSVSQLHDQKLEGMAAVKKAHGVRAMPETTGHLSISLARAVGL